MRRPSLLPFAVLALVSVSVAAYQSSGSGDLAVKLQRIGDKVEQYYARTQSIVCLETVRLQPLGFNLSPEGHTRQLVYELRVSWEPGGHQADRLDADGQDGETTPPEANVLRELVTVDGRPPKPKDEPGCLDPRSVSPEPLAMLLASRRRDYVFTWAGTSRTDGRASMKLDYKSVAKKPAAITWRDECVSVELPGRTRGRIWIDAETDQVLRLDEELTGMFEFPIPRDHLRFGGPSSMIIERADSSIKYRPVTFRDPDEILMLPSSIDSFTVVRNAGVPRLRTTQVFSNYKRFLTAGRIKEPGER